MGFVMHTPYVKIDMQIGAAEPSPNFEHKIINTN